MEQFSKPTWNKLNKLSKKEMFKLFDLAEVGLLNDVNDVDKDDLVLILSTEPESKILKALKQLKVSE